MTTIRVFLLDDSPAFLTAAAGFLANSPGIQVIGQSRSTVDALAKVAASSPDVVLATLDLPETNGLVAALHLKALPRPPRVIVVSDHTEPPYRILAGAVQADGFVVKSDFSVQAPALILDLMSRPAPGPRLASLGADVALALTRSDDPHEMLQQCTEVMVHNLDAALARIWTYDAAERVLRLQASAGISTQIDGEDSRMEVDSLGIGLIAQERRPQLSNEVQTDPRLSDPEWARREGMIGFAGYPLLVEDRLVGVMAMFSRRALDPAVLDALAQVADLIALGIERMASREALRRSEKRLQTIVNSARDTIFDLGADGRFQFLNPIFEAMTGWRCADWMGKPFESLLHPEDISQGIEMFRGALAGDVPPVFEVRIQRRSGGFVAVEITGAPLWEGDLIVGVHGIARDVTERMKAEAVIREAQDRLRRAVKAGNVGLWDWDLRTNQVYYSPEWKAQIGYADHEITNEFSEWQSRVHPEDLDRMLRAVKESLAGTAPNYAHEFRFRHKDGSYRWILVRGSVLHGEDGRPARMVGSHVDITDRTQLEHQFRQSQKMEGIGRLAGGIAHDFNNLLTVINGYADLALLGLREGDPLRTKIQEVRRAGDRAAALTRQLLAFSRKQVLQPVVLDLNSVVTDMERMLHRVIGEDIVLTLAAAEDLGRVKADPGQIEQVIMNLAINARDAMPGGGKLTIETANVELDQAFAAQHPGVRPGSYVMLCVTDTGSGMDKATRERIFEPFFTTKEVGKGTGLGLSTVYGIVEQSGGSIEVDSEVGKGTRFRIYLPSVAEEAGEIPQLRTPVDARGSETVLVVEDDEALRKLAAQIVAAAGYQILTASGGGEALLLLERHAGPVHLLLTDVLMPGMTGPDLLERLREVRPALKVLYMSGYTGEATAQLERIEQGVQFIGKPFSAAELTRRVRDILDLKI